MLQGVPSPGLLHQSKILVVDDNPTNTMLLEQILRKDGYRHVDSITDSTLAFECYQKHRHDMILLDIHMPGMTGFDVMAKLRLEYPNEYLPILILTSDTHVDTRHLCLASEAKDFLNKPFDRFEVLMRVRNIMEAGLMHKGLRQYSNELEYKVKERTKQLYDAQVKVIQCLGKAAEYRDNETGMHVVRMSRASAILGKQMGLDDDECELLLQASPMHDIGKIAIPDDVLLKPGKLEGDEWTTMKSHAHAGHEILGSYDTDLMRMAAIIAETHHEKWDGSGYPQGLKGTEIPLYSRIVAVCDVFDALTSTRPYKKAWSVEDSLANIVEQKGKQFDPDVVDSFCVIVDQVVALREEYPDNPENNLE